MFNPKIFNLFHFPIKSLNKYKCIAVTELFAVALPRQNMLNKYKCIAVTELFAVALLRQNMHSTIYPRSLTLLLSTSVRCSGKYFSKMLR